MEIIKIILSITAIISMALAVAVGLKNGIKSILFSIIMYVLAINYVLLIMSQSSAFDFYWLKYILLITNVLVGIAAFIHTKIQLPDSFKFKSHHIFGATVIILLCFYLFINGADDNSPIYHVLKSSVNFCFIFIALSDLNKKLSNNVSNDAISNIKKNQRFLVALFFMVITDTLSMCLQKYGNDNLDILLSSAYLILTVFIGYNELFYKLSKDDCTNLVPEDDKCHIEEQSDENETEYNDTNDDDISKNKIILSDERVKEIVTLIERYVAKNRKFHRDPDVKAKQMAIDIGVKYSEFSYALKKHFGLTFTNYINSLRVEEAKELLAKNKETNYTIEAIGIMVGFNTRNSFYLAFKKLTNTTPTKY